MKKEKFKIKREKGITLVALVITIIILLILAGISISALTNTGIFQKVKDAKQKSEDAQKKEEDLLYKYEDELSKYTSNDKWDGKVNKPELMTGMSAIKFTDPTDSTEGATVDTTSNDEEWYNYEEKKWANAITKDNDGNITAYWVWIPRYAYRVQRDESGNKTQKFDIVFLIGTTDNYYENGQLKTAQRQTKEDQTIVTDGDTYTVHPAFTNESDINYANGGWNKELAGIWVSKFEAGYASGNNNATVKASSVNYSETTAYVPAAETGTTTTITTARNWLDGEYAIKNGSNYEWKDGKETAIKYPTFQGLTYSMNYISHNDAYRISRALTESGNIYKLSSKETDSHLMKNSEWGAVAYLSQSKYGLNGTNIIINSISLSNTTKSVYAITGCAASTADSNTVSTTIDKINNRTQSNIYVWTQKNGTAASSTGTIYGIYDISGGVSERTAGLINNGNSNLTKNGNQMMADLNNGKSTKYITVYPTGETDGQTMAQAAQSNYDKNTKIYGDAIRETSTLETSKSSWYSDCSDYVGISTPFFLHGGYYGASSIAGCFSFGRTSGTSHYYRGFRSVLVSQ